MPKKWEELFTPDQVEAIVYGLDEVSLVDAKSVTDQLAKIAADLEAAEREVKRQEDEKWAAENRADNAERERDDLETIIRNIDRADVRKILEPLFKWIDLLERNNYGRANDEWFEIRMSDINNLIVRAQDARAALGENNSTDKREDS